jgi:multiple sugar transport system ATP-binding protein
VRVPLNGYDFATAPQDGMPVELGIRPEHVEVASGMAEATIDMIEPMGSDQLAWVKVAGAAMSLRLPADSRAAIGERLPVIIPAARANLFKLDDGSRL